VVLERAGVVHRIVTADEFARCEPAEDLTGHHHLICSECGDVRDFTVPASPESALARSLARGGRGAPLRGRAPPARPGRPLPRLPLMLR
jgi:Fe2+ or Zn2+ uptake regulation protein